MKKTLKTIKITLGKILLKLKDDDMMMYFKTEYKKNPEEAYEYWMNTGNKSYY